ISPQDREAFLTAIQRAAPERKRDGAYRWGVFEDVAQEGRWLETFMVDSWLEHIRQHRRVTNVDRALERAVYRFLIGPPRITHFIAPEAASVGDPGEILPDAEDARQQNWRTGRD
ncbi:MAG TPA: MFS transporter, partial [Burkholderiaceae bacterium]|nr:MFS transporter [Burkholderiaceae bacterium]